MNKKPHTELDMATASDLAKRVLIAGQQRVLLNALFEQIRLEVRGTKSDFQKLGSGNIGHHPAFRRACTRNDKVEKILSALITQTE